MPGNPERVAGRFFTLLFTQNCRAYLYSAASVWARAISAGWVFTSGAFSTASISCESTQVAYWPIMPTAARSAAVTARWRMRYGSPEKHSASYSASCPAQRTSVRISVRTAAS